MPAVKANGITIEYVEFGRKDDPAIILIMGLSNQLTAWPEEFCLGLANQGFRVIIFDNRDVGLSTKINNKRPPNIVLLTILKKLGINIQVPYTLDDMALDTVGLMDALNIDSAHIAGVSMGGMIAQIMAAKHKKRVKSLTCLITTSGNPGLPQAQKEVQQKMLKRPKGMDKETWINYYHEISMLISTPGTDPDEVLEKVRMRVNRSLYPEGTTRQLTAIIQNGSRIELLKGIKAPTLVVSGGVDPLVPAECGKDIADNIQGARYNVIAGWGHDLPGKYIPELVAMITGHIRETA